jgi:MOSC domain-containing protein YiiM
MSGRIASVNVGATAVIGERRGRPWRSAIVKEPVAGPVRVAELGLEGDDQHNRKYHGGPNQAVYAYAEEDVAWWSAELGKPFDATVLGHNLTTAGVDVSAVVIGERWRIGTALLEATSPRIPCATLAKRVGVPGMLKRFARAGRPGAYFRVLEEGTLAAGDAITVLERPTGAPTVADAMAILLFEHERARELLGVPGLNPVMADWAREQVG